MNYEYSDKYWDDYKHFLFFIEEIIRIEFANDDRLFEIYNSPNKLIDSWKETVDMGKDYHLSVFEWDNDISVRSAIEVILNNDKIVKLEYFHNNFKNQVTQIDREFIALTIDGSEHIMHTNWWKNRILKGGKGAYKEHILKFYKIDLKEYSNE